MKRKALAVLILLTLGVPLTLTPAQAANGPCSGEQFFATRRTPSLIREERMQRLIRCVFNYYGLGSEIPTALAISWRESHRLPWAWNRWSDCRGIFQHLGRYWSSRVYTLLPRAWFPRWPNVSAFHARANVIAAARMVKASGWGAWAL